MKVGLFTFGSRGDVQPFVALALGLAQAGHDVFVAAPSNFAGLVTRYGVRFRPMSVDIRQLAERPEVKRIIESGSNLAMIKGRLFARRHPLLEAANQDVWAMSADIEAMFFRAGAPSAAHSIARRRGIPALEVAFIPLEPSRELPAVAAGMRPRGRPAFNALMSRLTYLFFWRMFARSANRFRREVLGWPPLPLSGPRAEYARMGQPTLCAYSPAILPRPTDWRPDAHVVGYFQLGDPPDWTPPDDLRCFLEAGPKPVYVGFGSMPSANPAETARVVLEALRRTGQRVVLHSGWAELGRGVSLPNEVFRVEDVPHRWLLSRVASVIHHGGSGTSAAALRAGVPSVVVPHNFDQPFWAQRLYELGVAAKPIPLRRLTVEGLVAAIQATLSDTALRRRAAEFGAQIRDEDGVGRAIALFDAYVARFRNASPPAPARTS